jgi:hypothetical protein
MKGMGGHQSCASYNYNIVHSKDQIKKRTSVMNGIITPQRLNGKNHVNGRKWMQMTSLFLF